MPRALRLGRIRQVHLVPESWMTTPQGAVRKKAWAAAGAGVREVGRRVVPAVQRRHKVVHWAGQPEIRVSAISEKIKGAAARKVPWAVVPTQKRAMQGLAEEQVGVARGVANRDIWCLPWQPAHAPAS